MTKKYLKKVFIILLNQIQASNSENLPHPIRMAMITEQLKTNADEVVEKDELSFPVDGMQTGASMLGITMENP